MQKYDKRNTAELKKFIYNSCAHDAKIENIEYKCGEGSIKIEFSNSFFNVRTEMLFQDLEIVFAVKGKEYGNRETVISLTLEEDYSYLRTYLLERNEFPEGCLYLLFQMLSGDELHIVSRAVTTEITQQ